jgi:hypothetical protein
MKEERRKEGRKEGASDLKKKRMNKPPFPLDLPHWFTGLTDAETINVLTSSLNIHLITFFICPSFQPDYLRNISLVLNAKRVQPKSTIVNLTTLLVPITISKSQFENNTAAAAAAAAAALAVAAKKASVVVVDARTRAMEIKERTFKNEGSHWHRELRGNTNRVSSWGGGNGNI